MEKIEGYLIKISKKESKESSKKWLIQKENTVFLFDSQSSPKPRNSFDLDKIEKIEEGEEGRFDITSNGNIEFKKKKKKNKKKKKKKIFFF